MIDKTTADDPLSTIREIKQMIMRMTQRIESMKQTMEEVSDSRSPKIPTKKKPGEILEMKPRKMPLIKNNAMPCRIIPFHGNI